MFFISILLTFFVTDLGVVQRPTKRSALVKPIVISRPITFILRRVCCVLLSFLFWCLNRIYIERDGVMVSTSDRNAGGP